MPFLSDSITGNGASAKGSTEPKKITVKFGGRVDQLTLKQLSLFFSPTKRGNFPQSEDWPTPRIQEGPYCGFLALCIALDYARITKFSTHGPSKLIEIAKELKLTTVGEIINIKFFAHILQTLTIPHGKAIQNTSSHFIAEICKQVDEHNTVIASCDLGPNSNFPGVSGGARAHWALIFGYVYLKGRQKDDEENGDEVEDELYFLVTQYGKYFLWSAKDLQESNQQRADIIFPKCESFGGLFGDRFAFYTHHQIENHRQTHPTQNVLYIPDTTLQKFYNTIFVIPSKNPATNLTNSFVLADFTSHEVRELQELVYRAQVDTTEGLPKLFYKIQSISEENDHYKRVAFTPEEAKSLKKFLDDSKREDLSSKLPLDRPDIVAQADDSTFTT